MGSNDQTESLPGLGIQSRSGSENFAGPETMRDPQAIDPIADKVQFSIVCQDCGKHFWSRSKANSHAALTTHVLHEDDVLHNSSVTIPESPTTSPTSTHTPAEACRDMNFAEQEGSRDSGGDDYGSSFDCFEFPYYFGAASNQAILECMQDAELVPSSAADVSPISDIPSAAVARDIPAVDSSIHPSSPSWNASRARLSNTVITGAGSPTSPVNNELVIPTLTNRVSSGMSGRVIDPFPKQSSPPFGLNPEAKACDFENNDDSRRCLEVSPGQLASRLPFVKDLPRFTNIGDQKTSTRTKSSSPSSNSSCTTLEHAPVLFPRELTDRIFFIVTPSGDPQAPGVIMGLAEAQNAVTFRTGVHERLGYHGEQVRLRRIVAHIPWLSVRVLVDSSEDHYQMLTMIKSWPEWQKSNGLLVVT